MDHPITIDAVRGLHLIFLAMGLGSALYYDLRSMRRIAYQMWPTDFAELHGIHHIISIACLGLWVTGLGLIGIRTGFDFAQFSPKLIAKLIVVTVLSINAIVLAKRVIPALTSYHGHRLIDIPARLLLPMTLSAGLSLSCWMLALALGSSTYLKTADWSVLTPFLVSGTLLCVCGVTGIMFTLAILIRRADKKPGHANPS